MSLATDLELTRLDDGTLTHQPCRDYGEKTTSPDTEQEIRRIDALLNSFQTTSSLGRKDDSGKPRWSLVPEQAMEDVVKVLTYGARKYGDDNWRKVEDGPRRYYDAAMRHIMAYRQGHWADDESGMPHLAHAVASLLFIMALEREGK